MTKKTFTNPCFIPILSHAKETKKKKKKSAVQKVLEREVFVNWKISSFKKTPSIYIPPKPLPFKPSLLSISKLLLRASGGMITERRGL